MEILEFDKLDLADADLVEVALAVRENAYARYSNFKVGAAILSTEGNIYRGCNIESADYTLTSHAEMVAVDSMIADGNRHPKAIAIALRSGEGEAVPCGLCRQKLSEFADANLRIICVALHNDDSVREVRVFTLAEMLPHSFSSKNMDV